MSDIKNHESNIPNSAYEENNKGVGQLKGSPKDSVGVERGASKSTILTRFLSDDPSMISQDFLQLVGHNRSENFAQSAEMMIPNESTMMNEDSNGMLEKEISIKTSNRSGIPATSVVTTTRLVEQEKEEALCSSYHNDNESYTNSLNGSYTNSLNESMSLKRRSLVDTYELTSMKDVLVAKGHSSRVKNRSRILDTICNLSQLQKFYILTLVLPITISLWYSSAILFHPGVRSKVPFLLWTDGALVKNQQNQPVLCPRASICAEGILQVILIAMARLSAFASYPVMGITFLSKMHSTIHYLSRTHFSTVVPFQSLHEVHTHTGKMFGFLALLHTLTHYLRYILRRDTGQISTQVHISGLVGIVSIAAVVLSMSRVMRQRVAFEKRFNIHWMFVLVVLALLFHTPRTRIFILIFFCLWFADYMYGQIYRIHRLKVVEFMPIDGNAGTQMLWKNPKGFNVESGEYVFIKLPWLSEGGNEWHPFSIYLREATKDGLGEVYQSGKSDANMDKDADIDIEKIAENENLFEFTQSVLNTDFTSDQNAEDMLHSEAREGLGRYETTQVFINPTGDWTNALFKQVQGRKQLQSCWVKGPFTSPYFVTHEYGHFVMVASGIGITPALGVIGQYPGFSRTKILVWCTRSKSMLQFFAPLLGDAHLSVVFYTGKDKLTPSELKAIKSYGNIFVRQKRADSMTETVGSLITQFENSMNEGPNATSLRGIDVSHKKSWCVLYCGGSKRLRDEMNQFTIDNEVGWECELFNW